MPYTKISVAKPGMNLGVGGNKKNDVIVFDMDDVLSFPARDANGVVSTDNIVFKAGAYMIKLYAIQSTIDAGHKLEGDPDKKGYMQTVKFEHPGNENAIMEFDANWSNRNIGIIIQRCSDNKKRLFGTPCSPLQLVSDAKDNKDTAVSEFTFTSTQKGPIPCDYQGTTTFDAVKGTAAAAATVVDVTAGEGQYQLTTGVATAADLTALTNPVEGNVYTILGSGGAYPSTIAASGNWLLKSGTSWTALAGSSITLKAFKDGASSYKFLEISRT
jgi:hypothetical protein